MLPERPGSLELVGSQAQARPQGELGGRLVLDQLQQLLEGGLGLLPAVGVQVDVGAQAAPQGAVALQAGADQAPVDGERLVELAEGLQGLGLELVARVAGLEEGEEPAHEAQGLLALALGQVGAQRAQPGVGHQPRGELLLGLQQRREALARLLVASLDQVEAAAQQGELGVLAQGLGQLGAEGLGALVVGPAQGEIEARGPALPGLGRALAGAGVGGAGLVEMRGVLAEQLSGEEVVDRVALAADPGQGGCAGRVEAVALEERALQRALRCDVDRVDRDQALQAGDRLAPLTERLVGAGQEGQRQADPGAVARGADVGGEVGDDLFGLAELLGADAEVVVRLDVAGLELEGSLQGGAGGLELAGVGQAHPEHAVHVRALGRQLAGALQDRRRLGRAPEL